MAAVGKVFSSRTRYEGAQRLARAGRGPLGRMPVPGWTPMRDLPAVPEQSFRDWWRERRAG